MAFLDVIGELFGFANKTWKIKILDGDATDTEFKGQFVAERLEETLGSILGESSTVNKETPDFQWIRGEGETITFTSRLWASNSFLNIRQQVATFKSLIRRDPFLKRPPIIRFEVGRDLAFRCMVIGIRFRYDEIRSDGSLRGAIVDISLQKLSEFELEDDSGPTIASQIKAAAGIIGSAVGLVSGVRSLINVPGGSLHTIGKIPVAIQSETFESIAQKEYGDALRGDILRRVQPEKAILVPGDKVILIDRDEITQIVVTQQSVSLKNTARNLELRQLKLTARNRPTTVFI